MILLLDENTSLDFWRVIYPQTHNLSSPGVVPPEEPCACSARDAFAMAPRWLTQDYLDRGSKTLGVFFREHETTNRLTKSHRAREWKGDFPPEAFYPLKNGVYVSSPCFIFLQMARQLSLLELIAYGDEICGLYGFDNSNKRGMLAREKPLTTKAKLEHFIDSAVGQPGWKQAKKALQYIVERSASPMETLDEMLLCLPNCYGGYAIRIPAMNSEVPLTPEARMLSRLSRCYADISWPPTKLDIEYQGRLDHLDSAEYDADRRRINALRIMGYEVIELTFDQVADWQAFEILAAHIAKALGIRLRKRDLGLTEKRDLLRKTIFAWNASYGHPGTV